MNGCATVNPGASEYLPNELVSVTAYDSLNTLLLGLNAGEVDWALVSNSVADYICSQNEGFQKQLTYSAREEMGYLSELMYNALTNDYAIMLSAGKAELRDEINTALSAMKEDGTLDRLILDYITNATDEGTSHKVEFDRFEGAETIRFVVTGDLPPMDYVQADQTPTGFSTAVLAEIGRRLKKNIDVIATENLSRALELEIGRADAAFWTRTKNSIFEWMNSFTPEDLAEKANVPQLPVQRRQFSTVVINMSTDAYLEATLASDLPQGLLTTEAYYSEPMVMIQRKQ